MTILIVLFCLLFNDWKSGLYLLLLVIYCMRRLQSDACDLEMGHNIQYEYVATSQQGIAMNVSHVFLGSLLFN